MMKKKGAGINELEHLKLGAISLLVSALLTAVVSGPLQWLAR
jgi:hypothetical protein